MDAKQGDFLVGEELDQLYFLLDGGFFNETVEIDRDLENLLSEDSSVESFICDQCSKVCKSKRGLTRHKNTKHAQQTIPQPTNSTSEAITSEETILKKLHHLHLKKMVEKCAIKCSEDLCLLAEVRVKFTSQNFTFTYK